MADTAMTKLDKTKFIPFLDTSETVNSGTWEPNWKRIDLSTIFDLNPNAQTVERDYISHETAVDEITGYKPELPQEIAIYENNPIYDFVFSKFYELPVGSEAIVPALICFGGTAAKSWQVKQNRLVLGNLNSVEGKLSFTLKLGGSIERGTYAIKDGAPTFTPASTAE